MPLPLLPTSLVGSYPQPDWLIDREKLAGRFPPRVRAQGAVARRRRSTSQQAQDDATLLAIRDAGARRPRHHHRRRDPARELLQPLRHRARRRRPRQSRHRARPQRPSQSGAARRRQDPAQPRGRGARREVPARQHRRARSRSPCPGPFTMAQQAQNDFYKDEEEMALDYAAAVNEEIRDLFAAGADVVQIDEPYMQARPEKARQYGLKALNRALEGVDGHDRGAHLLRLRGDHPRAARAAIRSCPSSPAAGASRSRSRPRSRTSTARCWRSCPGKTIILGVLDLSDMTVETPETVAARIRRALPYVDAEQRHRRARLRHEVPAARGRVRQDAGDGRGREDRAERIGAIAARFRVILRS